MSPAPRSHSDRTFSPPRAIGRVLRVIETLAQSTRAMPLAELSHKLGLPKTSVFAILKGLEQSGYVVFEHGAYALGPTTRALAEMIAGASSFPSSTMPVLRELAQETGETVILTTLSEDRRHVVYAVVIEADSWLRFSVAVGTRRPLNAAASGHAILAYLPSAERERYLDQGAFERFTAKTVATRSRLRKVIADVRRHHCAMSVSGTVEAATGIAAPYFDRGGAVQGSLLLAAPTERIAGREARIKVAVLESATKISRLIGYTGSYPPS